jgi:type I restriction enzyme, R subunit
MSYNEQETRFSLIDPVLRDKGYNDHQWLKMETPAPVEPTGPKGRRRKGAGRTDYLLCVQVGDMPKALPVGVLEAKKETEDPLKGMQQAKGYADCHRFEVKYVFATNGHLYGEFDFCTNLQGGPLPFADFPPHPDLTARYAKDTGIDITRPEAAMLFQADSPAWSLTRYYQDAAANAPIHIATYQALGLDDEDDGFASFLSEHYGEDAFSVIIIDECHRSAWGKWSEVLKRNPNAIHIGLTATPRKLQESKHATAEDQEITANNHKYFGEPVYESTLIQAQEDGYLAACEIVGRKADIDKRVFTKEEILKAGVKDLRTGKPLTEADLTKDEYTGKDFDDELFIELRTPAMCEDLFRLLCANGGPEQKAIIFCNREIHADRVAMQMNNLYARWCKEHNQTPKDHYAFKRMGGPNNGAEMIEPMRGSGQRAFIACTVDLLEAGVDIERLNAVVFFRYLQSPIKFSQMVGRGTRIYEETQKYKFWLYDYTDVTNLFGTDFITKPPRPGGGGDGGDDGGIIADPPWPTSEPPSVAEMGGHYVTVTPQGGFILTSRDGRDTPIPVDEYRREVIQRVVSEAHNLDEFRRLWIETQKRCSLINHLLGDNFSPEVIREIDQMTDFDLYDFSQGGTEALETPSLWDVPEIKLAGGLATLKKIGQPVAVMHEAKGRLFAI